MAGAGSGVDDWGQGLAEELHASFDESVRDHVDREPVEARVGSEERCEVLADLVGVAPGDSVKPWCEVFFAHRRDIEAAATEEREHVGASFVVRWRDTAVLLLRHHDL